MRHVSRLSEGVTGSIYDIRTGWLCVSIARKVCVEKVGQEEIQVNVATYHIRHVRVLSMCVRARVPFTFNFREGCLCPALLNRNKG